MSCPGDPQDPLPHLLGLQLKSHSSLGLSGLPSPPELSVALSLGYLFADSNHQHIYILLTLSTLDWPRKIRMMFAAQEGLKNFGEGQKDSTALEVFPFYMA